MNADGATGLVLLWRDYSIQIVGVQRREAVYRGSVPVQDSFSSLLQKGKNTLNPMPWPSSVTSTTP